MHQFLFTGCHWSGIYRGVRWHSSHAANAIFNVLTVNCFTAQRQCCPSKSARHCEIFYQMNCNSMTTNCQITCVVVCLYILRKMYFLSSYSIGHLLWLCCGLNPSNYQ